MIWRLTYICFAVAFVATLSPAAIAANSNAPKLEAGVAPHAQIDALYEQLSRAVEALDTSTFGSIYAANSLYLPPNKTVIRGLAGVKSNWNGWFAWMKEAKGSLDIDFRIVSREVHGNIGYDVGYYKTLQVRPGESSKTFEGKFVVVTKEQTDGRWLFQVDAYNHLKKPK
ncbi:MAG: YybH family protein [Hyphomicrobiaceae bacterium]